MERDRLGRRRSPEQGRGLRPLHPPLPEEWTSKVLRVAMPESDWERFEALAGACAPMAPTQARAHGTGALGPAAFRPGTPAGARAARLDGLGAAQDAPVAAEEELLSGCERIDWK